MTLGWICLIGVAIVTGACLGHRLLAWADRRGWVYYGRRTPPPMGMAANALLQWETLWNPAAEHVLEYRRNGDLWVQTNELGGDESETVVLPPGVESRG